LTALRDQFDEIATQLANSEAALASTILYIGLAQGDQKYQAMAIRHTDSAYKRICESICYVRIPERDLVKLGVALDEIKLRLKEAISES
jgi:hypothetical protein